MYRITIELLEYAHISSYVGYTYIILFTCIINLIQKKKANILYHNSHNSIYIHRNIRICEYVYDPQDYLQPRNHKRN